MTADATTDTLPGRVLVTTEPLDPVVEQDHTAKHGHRRGLQFDGLVRAISEGRTTA